jgi:riboflavin kinase/FMN adenylyltransferase
MKVFAAAPDLAPGSRPVCAALGFFDGVHLGHQEVLRHAVGAAAARREAMTVAVTFDRHPNVIVAPANVPPLIYPLSKKLELLASLGLDAACVIQFDKTVSLIPGEQFVRGLARDFRQIESICVGDNFMFGWKRSGNVALLQKLGGELGFEVQALRDVSWNDEPVSSTRIREAIRVGDFAAAHQMLGRPYSLRGRVIQGVKLGRELGFPTANLEVSGLIVPPAGVYAAEARLGEERLRAAVNIGHRPTVAPASQLTVEAHLLDFDRQIYGDELELAFFRKLREEQKFPSQSALRSQIAKDIFQARNEAN